LRTNITRQEKENQMASNDATADRIDRNKEVIHRFYNAVNTKHREVFLEIVHPDFVNHGGAAGDIAGPQALIDSLNPFYEAMPDWHVTEDFVLAENDKVASRGTITGTHKGPFMGIPPTGKAVAWTGIIIYRLNAEGKVIERWQDFDALGMLQQMGVVPVMGPPAPLTKPVEAPPLPRASAEQLKQSHGLSEKFFAALNARDWNAFDQVVAPDCLDHDPIPMQAKGRDGLKAAYQYVVAGFPDVTFKVEEVVADGDMAIARTSMDGTNTGFFMITPATGKKAHWTAHRMFRFKNGQVVETWQNVDVIGLMVQLGLVPAPAAT
jgi:steroid delta-isomerase-like uncharacterized protein